MNGEKPKITIRKIGSDEVPVLVDYRLLYLTELQEKQIDKDPSQVKKEMENYFRKGISEGKLIALLAEKEGEVVSFGAMVIKEIPGDFSRSVYLEGDILNMYTIPKARRQGISAMILEQLIAESRQLGISKLALHTSNDGEYMYRKTGFSEPQFPYLEMIINIENFTH